MKVAFDTSVVIAGTHDAHPHHHRASAWVDAVRDQKIVGVLTWHALAEIWSVLTRLPSPARLTPEQALCVIRRLQDVFQLYPLEPHLYDEALQRCTDRGFASGVVFDALHLVCAEHVGVDALVTFNGADFHRLANPSSPRIIIPPDPPGVAF